MWCGVVLNCVVRVGGEGVVGMGVGVGKWRHRSRART